MFQYMFLQRLPVTLRTFLGEQEPGDIRSLAARQTCCGPLTSNSLTICEEQPAAQIAAVRKKEPKQKKKFA